MNLYGQSWFWTKPDGSTTTGFIYGFWTKAEAMRAAREHLERLGWTPPRWWQISRWRDTPR